MNKDMLYFYIGQYFKIEDMLTNTFRYVDINKNNLNCYSLEYMTIIFQSCSAIDGFFNEKFIGAYVTNISFACELMLKAIYLKKNKTPITGHSFKTLVNKIGFDELKNFFELKIKSEIMSFFLFLKNMILRLKSGDIAMKKREKILNHGHL